MRARELVTRSLFVLVWLLLVSGEIRHAWAEPPAAPKVSTFAPMDDLVGQIKYFKERAEKGVASKDDFDDGAQNKLKKDANTLAVLSLTLALHDGDHPLKAKAAGILAAAQKVAGSAKTLDHAASKSAVEELAKVWAGDAKSDHKLTWNDKVGDFPALMKAVPLINTGLKKGVAKMDQAAAGNAATLAVIAQATMADTSAVKNPADTQKWYAFSAEMRDAAAAVNQGLHAKEKDKVEAGMKRPSKSCETCHEVFRKDAAGD